MNTSALIMMMLANGVVIGVTAYFFLRVLRSAPPDEPDQDDLNYPRGG